MASMTIRYTLRIEVPETIDGDTWAEILADSEPHDATPDQKIRRWASGWAHDAGQQVSEWLPEGWYAKVDDQL